MPKVKTYCPHCERFASYCQCPRKYAVMSGTHKMVVNWRFGSFTAVSGDHATEVSEFQRQFLENWPNSNFQFVPVEQ